MKKKQTRRTISFSGALYTALRERVVVGSLAGWAEAALWEKLGVARAPRPRAPLADRVPLHRHEADPPRAQAITASAPPPPVRPARSTRPMRPDRPIQIQPGHDVPAGTRAPRSAAVPRRPATDPF